MSNVYIIAEAGVNHNGDIKVAKKLIDVAAALGVDAIKFQTFKTENLVSRNAEKADYQKKNSGTEETQFEMIKKLELDIDAHKDLISYCDAKNITFLSTPFDIESVDLLAELGIDIFKIPSGEITNLPYLEHIGKLNKKVILSTGMSNIDEIGAAMKILMDAGTLKDKITILHANTEYPTPMCDVNLLAMNTIGEKFGVTVGYSDHTLGIEVPTAAVALGAKVIEKHFTLDRSMDGPDHKASLEPLELKRMVTSIRNIEEALGTGIKEMSSSEKKNLTIARKSIVANTNIKKGDLFTEKNVTIKRPGNGISPMEWYNILGREANKDFTKDELIEI